MGGKVQRLGKSEDLPDPLNIRIFGKKDFGWDTRLFLSFDFFHWFCVPIPMRIRIHISLWLLPLLGFGQSADTVKTLGEAEVRALPRDLFQTGRQVRRLSSSGTQSLGDALFYQSGWFIKSYGPSQLATTGIRGSSASQSPVLWNGFNLQSPMNSTLDLSLVPSMLFESVELTAGGGTDLFGSGAIGGTLRLEQNTGKSRGFSGRATAGLGSFGRYELAASAANNDKSYGWNVKPYYVQAENNFPFHNSTLPGNPIQYQQNASLNNLGLMHGGWWKAGNYARMEYQSWIQSTRRGLAPTLLQSSSRERQEDAAWRQSLSYSRKKGNSHLLIRGAWLQEELLYANPSAKYTSLNKARSIIQETEYSFTSGKIHYLLGYNNTWQSAASSGYNSASPQMWRPALFGALAGHWRKARTKWKLSGRQEWANRRAAPFCLNLGLEQSPDSHWTWHGQISRVYRQPNFNDLYWVPGGNPGIRPENGFTSELGVRYQRNVSTQHILDFQVNTWYNKISNWIQWTPENGYWTPQNLKEVHSRGIEWEARWTWIPLKSSLRITGTYTRCSNEQAAYTGDISVGKQLIYQPIWKHAAEYRLYLKPVQFIYRHQFTDLTYTSSDHSSWLRHYHTGMLAIQYNRVFGQQALQAEFTLYNIWNQDYQVLMWRPMPGIHYQLTLQYTFN